MERSAKELGYDITLIDAEYGHSGVASIYLIEQQGRVAIIETGTNNSLPFIEVALQDAGLSFDNVDYIIPTHVHLDHAGGAGELMHKCVNAQLVVHPFGAKHLIDPSKLEAGTIAVYGEENFRKLYGSIRPIEESRVIEAPDNFKLNLNGRELLFLDTPGHARHHFCIYDKKSSGIFSGDTFGVSYPQLSSGKGRLIFATTTPVQFDPGALLNSIDRLMSLEPRTIFLTHFGPITPAKDVVDQLKNSVNKFKEIALEEKETKENRIDRIQLKINDYLLEQVDALDINFSHEECLNVIKMDTQLNAQGLDFWLSKTS